MLGRRVFPIGTGHYCRKYISSSGEIQLWEGKDKNKDQSYFFRITREQLKFAEFPIVNWKAEVRARVGFGFGRCSKKDSQGICFLGKVKVPEFLSHFIEDQPGDIITVQGKVVGQHKGLHRYTLGQRRGIGVPSNTDHQNYVVTGKDQSSNQLIVAFENEHEETLWAKKFEVIDLSFVWQ